MIIVLVVAAACTLAVDSGPATEAGPGTQISELCQRLGGLPFPLRRSAIDESGPADEVLSGMDASCPQVLDDLAQLERIVSASALLDDADLVSGGVTEPSCGESGIAVGFANPFQSPVRLVLAGAFVDTSGVTTVAGASVSDPIEPGERQRLMLPLVPTAGSSGCRLDVHPFLHEPDRGVTDTWDPAAGLAPGPDLPVTTGSDWLGILSAIVDFELAIERQGAWVSSGGFEDVRSKNYSALTGSTEPAESSGEVPAVCSVELIDEGVTLVVYEYSDDLVDRAVAAGVFRRSPQDGRWRWLVTSMLLDLDGTGCAVLGGGMMA
jgi:hypothetical protein